MEPQPKAAMGVRDWRFKVRIEACLPIHTYVHIHTYIYIYRYRYTHIDIHRSMWTCVCVYIYIYIHCLNTIKTNIGIRPYLNPK